MYAGGMQLWWLGQKLHVSWLVAISSMAIVIGIAMVPSLNSDSLGSMAWFVCGLVLVAIGFWQRSISIVVFVIMGGLLIGLWRGSVAYKSVDVYGGMIGKVVQATGTITDDPDIGKGGVTVLRLNNVSVDGKNIGGTVWVTATKRGDIRRSDSVIVRGKLSAGFGSFSAALYRAEIVKVERSQPGDVALQVRDWFAESVRTGIDEPQVSLGLGYLLGLRRSLPPDLDEALVIAGLTHIVVASGYNLTILVRLARRLFVKVSKYLAALSAGSMIVAFIAVTGMSPSMSRAGLVAGLSLAAWYYGRKVHPLVLLPFAAAVTVLMNPAYAWNDLGWQLSFAAFAGVMILAPLLQRYFYGDKKPGTIRQIIGETVSATVVTAPILVLAFGQFSNVAIIANLLILPMVPLAMLLTFIAGIGAMVAPAFATIIGLPAQMLLTYMTMVAHYFADLPWAQATLEIQPWLMWTAYIMIIAICVYLWRVTKYDLRQTNIVE